MNRSRRQNNPSHKKRHSELLSWVLCITGAIIVALLLRMFVFELVSVDGSSMQPTLEDHQTVFVEKISHNFGNLDRGQVIIVHYPHRDGSFVKRIVGLPGDTVEVKDGFLYVNGLRRQEDYILDEYIDYEYGPYTVPQDHYFVMGDNRNNSLDSHSEAVGPISFDEVVGHALFVIWPVDQIHGLTDAGSLAEN